MRKVNNPFPVGTKFNKLTIIEIIPDYKTGKTYKTRLGYQCKCDCGNTCSVAHLSFARKDIKWATKSCGCSHKKSGDKYSSVFNEVYKYYRLNARKRNYGFSLTKEQFEPLIFGDCYYCRSTPSNNKLDKRKNTRMTYNGIDRKDNTKGYTPENSVSCCAPCNRMKMAFDIDFFKEHITKIYENRGNF